MIIDYQKIKESIDAMPLSVVMDELSAITKGKASRWRSVRYQANGETVSIRDVAYMPDGSIEANGNNRDLVARAILKAVTAKKMRRTKAAKQGAATRAVRRERQIYTIVQRLKAGGQLTPSISCRICGKAVNDESSRLRGIGPDCWQEILSRLESLAESA